VKGAVQPTVGGTERSDSSGVKLHHPGALAGYCLLNLPFGLALYGVNVSRRGGKVMGTVFVILGTGLFGLMILAAAMGTRVSGIGILGIFVGLGIFGMEYRPYTRAIRDGAGRARWWPPLLVILGAILLLASIVVLVDPGAI